MQHGTTLEELAAMLEQQDHELEEARTRFDEILIEHPGVRFEVPAVFFAELEDACTRRGSVAAPFTFAMRA